MLAIIPNVNNVKEVAGYELEHQGNTYRYLKNGSGGALAEGDVVVLKASDTTDVGTTVTTSTTANDALVAGVAAEAIANGVYGRFLVKGNGNVNVTTAAVAVGERLAVSGTAKKAVVSTNASAFATALEANEATGDDDLVLARVCVKS